MRLFMICGLCIFMHCPSRYAVLLYNYIHMRKVTVTLISPLYVFLVLLSAEVLLCQLLKSHSLIYVQHHGSSDKLTCLGWRANYGKGSFALFMVKYVYTKYSRL